ncbi:chromosome partitioning protein ParB [Brevirhabdus pacifica]|uniref:Chromosome partitioning protein ParB n=1 Tax=Brevirhabdus pacifica TaxID=1267768 RepID=A0A1U7DIN4_9RHOB|nr:ParB/RepB/Spo0J family partition protein [Brevirhabdus pacifica]APX89831.1 chromosome partitioning protein ParB [Brevirhabdus pacifica]OWU74444.1 chromosome partitioning protein ParB [Loktanella sp. 22II-4b]PJJ82957.1 chromosome segregation DNA-binding protein [Brevirhabdus pacifica]
MSDKKQERRGLGRGLSALMADVDLQPGKARSEPAAAERVVPIEKIAANPDQPRRDFSAQALQELTDSVREKGIIQPLIVRPHPAGADRFEIVAGERRWRAAQRAQLHEIPVIVRDLDDTEVLELAIIENIQRADLNAVEEAAGYKQLMEKFGHTQERLSASLGKSRSHIANLMRLLQLPEDVQDHLRQGRLSAGHARALITTENPSELARQVIAKGLSVRQTEDLAKGGGGSSAAPKASRKSSGRTTDPDTLALEDQLTANLGLEVRIEHQAGQESGRMVLNYKDLDQLDGLIALLNVRPMDVSR